MMEPGAFCVCTFFSLWLGVAGFVIYNLATKGIRGAGLGASVLDERTSFRTESSGLVKTDISVVTTTRREAPIAIAIVQRAPLSIAGSGASMTRDQALTVASWLRQAASGDAPRQ